MAVNLLMKGGDSFWNSKFCTTQAVSPGIDGRYGIKE
jgi:hypothetical protein